jgi:plastocyanin
MDVIVRQRGVLFAAATAALISVVACFSERDTPTEAAAAAVCQVPENADVDGSTVVFIRRFAFHPATVRVKRGARITWVNCENTPGLAHSTTAEAGGWAHR